MGRHKYGGRLEKEKTKPSLSQLDSYHGPYVHEIEGLKKARDHLHSYCTNSHKFVWAKIPIRNHYSRLAIHGKDYGAASSTFCYADIPYCDPGDDIKTIQVETTDYKSEHLAMTGSISFTPGRRNEDITHNSSFHNCSDDVFHPDLSKTSSCEKLEPKSRKLSSSNSVCDLKTDGPTCVVSLDKLENHTCVQKELPPLSVFNGKTAEVDSCERPKQNLYFSANLRNRNINTRTSTALSDQQDNLNACFDQAHQNMSNSNNTPTMGHRCSLLENPHTILNYRYHALDCHFTSPGQKNVTFDNHFTSPGQKHVTFDNHFTSPGQKHVTFDNHFTSPGQKHVTFDNHFTSPGQKHVTFDNHFTSPGQKHVTFDNHFTSPGQKRLSFDNSSFGYIPRLENKFDSNGNRRCAPSTVTRLSGNERNIHPYNHLSTSHPCQQNYQDNSSPDYCNNYIRNKQNSTSNHLIRPLLQTPLNQYNICSVRTNTSYRDTQLDGFGSKKRSYHTAFNTQMQIEQNINNNIAYMEIGH